MGWEASDLVAAVRRRAMLPDSSADGAMTDADILALADEEISLRLVPLVRSARENYFVTYEDTTVEVGKSLYRIPERAQGGALREVTIVDSSGNEYSIPQLSTEEAGVAERYSSSTVFIMEGPNVRLIPAPVSALGTLRMRYHRAHSQLQILGTSQNVAVGATIDDTSCSSGDLFGTEPIVGLTVDVEYVSPPFGPISDSVVTASGTTGGTVVFGSAIFDGIAASTPVYVSIANYTPVVSLPRECWPLLVSAVTSRVLEVMGDRDAAQLAFALYERESGNVVQLLTPRVEGARKKIIAHRSPLRDRKGW